MNKKILLDTLDNHIDQEAVSSKIYQSDYLMNSDLKIGRDGIFFSLFNKVFDPTENKIPHVTLSRFDVFKEQDIFYRLNCHNEFQWKPQSAIIMLFNLNSTDTPLELLNDFMKTFHENHLAKNPAIKVVAHYNYAINMTVASEQKYLLSYFQIIEKYLGKIPDSLSLLDLKKKASFENTLVVEAGSQWACLDNFLVHLILSKGGNLFQQTVNKSSFSVSSEVDLSPHHSLQMVKKLKAESSEIVSPFMEDLKEKNFFKHPEDFRIFYYLMYRNIF